MTSKLLLATPTGTWTVLKLWIVKFPSLLAKL